MKELDTAKDVAVRAGNAIRLRYKGNYNISYKEEHRYMGHTDKNPVTDADIISNKIIKDFLSREFPNYGWLSEETKLSSERFTKERGWIVDPLDGTIEFSKGIPEFTVSIGLVEGETPILGVVYNPITDELFWATRGEGAFSITNKSIVLDMVILRICDS